MFDVLNLKWGSMATSREFTGSSWDSVLPLIYHTLTENCREAAEVLKKKFQVVSNNCFYFRWHPSNYHVLFTKIKDKRFGAIIIDN